MFDFSNGRTMDVFLLASEVDRLQRLATDLMMLADGHFNVSQKAPVLNNWIRTSRNATCLAGEVSDHPNLPGNGRLIITSDLCVIAEELGYARTISRWYRLGRPNDSNFSS
jgi:hypothetical protein